MVRALTIGISVMTGILIGRIQIIDNHEAKEAVRATARAEQRADAAKRDATRTRLLLDHAERQLLGMWRRLDPMLEDFTAASSIIDRDFARRRIESLRWEMSSVDAAITAAREAAGEDKRTAMRQVHVKHNMRE